MFVAVLQGTVPLFIHVNNAEQISQVLDVKTEIDKLTDEGYSSRFVLVGGAGAWRVAEKIAQTNNTSVLLNSVRCTPEDYDSKRCRSQSSLEHPILTGDTNISHLAKSSLNILYKSGVSFAIVPESDNMAKDLVWDSGLAGWISNRYVDGTLIKGEPQMTRHEMVGLSTWKVKEIVGLNKDNVGTLDIGKPNPNFLVYLATNGKHPTESVESRLMFSLLTVDSREGKHESIMRILPKQL